MPLIWKVTFSGVTSDDCPECECDDCDFFNQTFFLKLHWPNWQEQSCQWCAPFDETCIVDALVMNPQYGTYANWGLGFKRHSCTINPDCGDGDQCIGAHAHCALALYEPLEFSEYVFNCFGDNEFFWNGDNGTFGCTGWPASVVIAPA